MPVAIHQSWLGSNQLIQYFIWRPEQVGISGWTQIVSFETDWHRFHRNAPAWNCEGNVRRPEGGGRAITLGGRPNPTNKREARCATASNIDRVKGQKPVATGMKHFKPIWRRCYIISDIFRLWADFRLLLFNFDCWPATSHWVTCSTFSESLHMSPPLLFSSRLTRFVRIVSLASGLRRCQICKWSAASPAPAPHPSIPWWTRKLRRESTAKPRIRSGIFQS